MEYQTILCEDCGGRGVDPGSLHQPEPCPSCAGYGTILAPEEVERIARKRAGRATEIERMPEGWFEERRYRVGE